MSINITLPSDVMISEFELSMMLATKLLDQGIISSVRAPKWWAYPKKHSSS